MRIHLQPLIPPVLALLGASSLAGLEASPTAVVERRLLAMDTFFDLRIEAADRATALAGSERAVEAVRRVESQLSIWRDDTVLMRLNRAVVGEVVILPAEVSRGLLEVRACSELTEGGFDPTVGSSWVAGLEGFSQVDDRSWVRLFEDVAIDSGGYAKGAALDAALEALAATGVRSATLDLGGQLGHYRSSVDSVSASGVSEWTVEVADPRDRNLRSLVLRLSESAVATSGLSVRGDHILDPKTGRPVDDRGSLTVVAQSGLLADCLSTGLYVLGPDRALALAAADPSFEVVVQLPWEDGLRVVVSRSLAGRVDLLQTDSRLEVFEFSQPAPSSSSPEIAAGR